MLPQLDLTKIGIAPIRSCWGIRWLVRVVDSERERASLRFAGYAIRANRKCVRKYGGVLRAKEGTTSFR